MVAPSVVPAAKVIHSIQVRVVAYTGWQKLRAGVCFSQVANFAYQCLSCQASLPSESVVQSTRSVKSRQRDLPIINQQLQLMKGPQQSSQQLLAMSQTTHPKILEETIHRELQQSPFLHNEDHAPKKSASFNKLPILSSIKRRQLLRTSHQLQRPTESSIFNELNETPGNLTSRLNTAAGATTAPDSLKQVNTAASLLAKVRKNLSQELGYRVQDDKPIETAMLSMTERKNKLRSKDLKKLSSSQITQATLETDFKLCKMIEVAQNDKELIEIQRKAIYMQRLEFHSLSLNHEALQRNFEALSNQVLVERQEKAELQLKINQLANERLSINDRIKELQDKLGAVGLGDREYDMRKEMRVTLGTEKFWICGFLRHGFNPGRCPCLFTNKYKQYIYRG